MITITTMPLDNNVDLWLWFDSDAMTSPLITGESYLLLSARSKTRGGHQLVHVTATYRHVTSLFHEQLGHYWIRRMSVSEGM